MSEGVPAPWPISVPRPTFTLRVLGSPDTALGALRQAVEAEGYRVTSTVGPAGFEASRMSWKDLLGGSLPQRGVVIAAATAQADATLLRVAFPTGGNDWGARQRAVRVLTSTVGSLRAVGVAVQLGEWEPGLPPR